MGHRPGSAGRSATPPTSGSWRDLERELFVSLRQKRWRYLLLGTEQRFRRPALLLLP